MLTDPNTLPLPEDTALFVPLDFGPLDFVVPKKILSTYQLKLAAEHCPDGVPIAIVADNVLMNARQRVENGTLALTELNGEFFLTLPTA